MVYHFKMAKEVMEVFPKTPTIFHKKGDGASKKSVGHGNTDSIRCNISIFFSSVFDKEVNCAMCAGIKPPGSVPHHTHTDWVRFSVTAVSGGATQCLHMDQKSLEEAQVGDWVCSLCNK
ncbi:hypothetical protein F7725_025500 [Dissostichus mawsoni]|uniref:Uncharacterized protein n=1 Tax=Dissostichus mawsoni TaxID=36200 RepID=A0A7J5XBB4_DISMA|nr:hypothetical protein F7725_025500 [Dissostichus mawsoni]